MNLLDIYVSEVGRNLPRKNREDIEAEIRSILTDLLAERSKETGKPVDDEMTFDVLKNYGDPQKVAASYQEERYLIGPRLYPTFIMVLRIVFPVIAILAGFGAIINVSMNVPSVVNVAEIFVNVLGGILTAVITSLGWIMIIFAIIEWVTRNERITIKSKTPAHQKEWDPHSLTRIKTPNQLKTGDLVIEMVGCALGIVLFNFYRPFFGYGIASGGEWYIGLGNHTVTPLFSQAFFNFIPYLTALWVLTILLDILLLRQGTWTTLTRTVSIALKTAGMAVAVVLLVQPSLVSLTAETLSTYGFSASSDSTSAIIFSLNQLIRLILIVTILLSGLDIVRAIIRLVRTMRTISVK